MQLKTFILHFILGGTIVSVVTFLGSQGKGMLAAFVATFPTMTALTFALIYSKGGQVATVNYGQGSALHDAAVDYLCLMPDLSVAQVGICEVASCRRADLYDPCRDCQYCYETSGAGIINDNEDNTICNSCEVSPYNCIDIANQYYYIYNINSINHWIII